MKRILFALLVAVAGSSIQPAEAQDATERAGQLKVWREQCADPDIDLRTAYIEAAIATADTSIIRICVRQALQSDDADIRNLGLRAALGSASTITFIPEMSPEYAKALKEAGDNEGKLAEISNWYADRIWKVISTGITFEVDKADLVGGVGEWFPMVNLGKRNENYTGMATIVGSRVTWSGTINFTPSQCILVAEMDSGGELVGSLRCGDVWPFPLRARLL